MSTEDLPRVIMVCGVAGVGKTSLIKRFIAKHPAAMTLSAGAIIAEARKATDPEILRALPVNELERSQSLLVQGFSTTLPTISAPLLLFDAHTVIDGNEGIYSVPLEVFSPLRLSEVIHVEAVAAELQARRRLDTLRVRPERSIAELHEYQLLSAERAGAIACALSIRLATVKSGDLDSFEALLLPM